MPVRTVSVSLAAYDGHPVPAALDSLARCGVGAVEPAFIVGYTEPFDETAFDPAATRQFVRWLAEAGLACPAMSAHIDLGRAGAADTFRGRMEFAAALGASIIATNAAATCDADRFGRNIEVLAGHARTLGLTIGLENPGDGRDNLLDSAVGGLALIERIGSPWVRLNYDPANLASHRPDGPSPAEDAVRAIPACVQMHLKDVRRTPDGWFFTPLGQGDNALDKLFPHLAAHPGLALSIELPLRLHRTPDARPARSPAPVPLPTIEAAIRASVAFVDAGLGADPD